MKYIIPLLVAVLFVSTDLINATACTRAVYHGNSDLVMTGRSMDWLLDIQSNMWIFPRGMKRDGAAGPHSATWTSRYGSVVVSAYDICSVDGINEKGLGANLLYLTESVYPKRTPDKKDVSVSIWLQYVLDNFATVKEAVDALEKEEFSVLSGPVPDRPEKGSAGLHLSISDKAGDSAIFEYIDGRLAVHHDASYRVMTNTPAYEKQLVLNAYWSAIDGAVMLPGTNRAVDRFVRASYYLGVVPKTDNPHLAAAYTLGIIRNCSVPFGVVAPGEPNISPTRWRTVMDHKNGVYYFESTTTPNVFWVDLKKIDFQNSAGVKRLNLAHGEVHAGEVRDAFVASEPFKPQIAE